MSNINNHSTTQAHELNRACQQFDLDRDKKVTEKKSGARTVNQFALKAEHQDNIKEDSRFSGGRHNGKYAHIKLISATSVREAII
ncbi:unnamed protein product [Schistosoma curassoni]|uniref:EF-hand domain-containing protein n=1 Tax=Schistosoma curassoni TaxID=6186 RepID=A0A183JNQ5_9TREM|nr:unnamed protein product [Schistosoma curassoni]